MSLKYGDTIGFSCVDPLRRVSLNSNNEFIPLAFEGHSGAIENKHHVQILRKDIGQYIVHGEVVLYSPKSQTWQVTCKDAPLQPESIITIQSTDSSKYLAFNNKQGMFVLSPSPCHFVIHKLQLDPIEHVVVLMMENRSFFRMFGYMDEHKDTYVNVDSKGNKIVSAETSFVSTLDPPHEIGFVTTSLENSTPGGFVKAFENFHGEKATAEDIKVPGPTWPNRMFALSGTSFGWATTPETSISANTVSDVIQYITNWIAIEPPLPQAFSIFDLLREKKIPFGVDGPFKVSLTQLFYANGVRDNFYSKFKKRAESGELEKFCFVEPCFVDAPFFGHKRNDDHPPCDPMPAQHFIAQIYEALRTSPKWRNTLLVITYDEHGGFFDPVEPTSAAVPDSLSEETIAFSKFGVRVPTILVSPCISKGIDDTLYDHTSVLKYVLNKWAPDAVHRLGERVLAANTLPVLSTPRDEAFPPLSFAAPEKRENITPSTAAHFALRDPSVRKITKEKIRSTIIEKATNAPCPKAAKECAKKMCNVYLGASEEERQQRLVEVRGEREGQTSPVELAAEDWQVLERQLEFDSVLEHISKSKGRTDDLEQVYLHLMRNNAHRLAKQYIQKRKMKVGKEEAGIEAEKEKTGIEAEKEKTGIEPEPSLPRVAISNKAQARSRRRCCASPIE